MFLSKIPFLLKGLIAESQHEAAHVGVSTCKFLRCATSYVKFSTTTRQQNKQQDSTVEHRSSLSISTGTPDKLYKKVEIEVRGNDPAVLKSYGLFAVTAANHLRINVGRNAAPYKAIHEHWTVLKSAHVHKKHRVQYEIRTYYRYLDFLRLTGSTADTFLEYLQRNLPEGVAMKVTKVEIQKLPDSITAISST